LPTLCRHCFPDRIVSGERSPGRLGDRALVAMTSF
jgi:hypothetical protein